MRHLFSLSRRLLHVVLSDRFWLTFGTFGLSSLALAAPEEVSRLETLSITAPALPAQGVQIREDLGSAVYAIDHARIEQLSEGEASSLGNLAVHLPGVSEDSKSSGSFHIRNEHANVQYRINGIQLPDSLAGFGASLDVGMIDQLDLLTGILPAQYGLHTAGVIDIRTRQEDTGLAGKVDIGWGSITHPFTGLQVYGGHDSGSGFVSLSRLNTPLGIENPNPTSTALHDDSQQFRLFGQWSEKLNERHSLSVLVAHYQGQYEIPNRLGEIPQYTGFYPGLTTNSQALNEHQNEESHFTALSWQYTSAKLTSTLTVYQHSAHLHYLPDPQFGDLAFLGASNNADRSVSVHGLQWDSHFDGLTHHVIRLGGLWTGTLSSSINQVTVLTPQNAPTQMLAISDNSGLFGISKSLYLADEWHLSPAWQLNTGLRWDQVYAYTAENQTSPRIQLAVHPTPGSLIHLGFAEYFTPPPQELAAQKSIALYNNTTNAAEVTTSSNVRAERSRYWDLGAKMTLTPALDLSLDAYFKRASALLDEGQFGNALILSPYNYQEGLQRGIEASLNYNTSALSAYLNLAWARGEARNIISGQALFGAQELTTLSQRAIFLDHDQTWTGSFGMIWHHRETDLGVDVVAGSGLRKTGADGIPNHDHLPGYAFVDVSAIQHYTWDKTHKIEARLSLLNAFDRRYLLRDGTGVGVGAPQYGAYRTIFAGATIHF